MARINVRVFRSPTGDYYSQVDGDIDALVAVSVTHIEQETIEVEETVYQNDASLDMWEDFHRGDGPNPLHLDSSV